MRYGTVCGIVCGIVEGRWGGAIEDKFGGNTGRF